MSLPGAMDDRDGWQEWVRGCNVMMMIYICVCVNNLCICLSLFILLGYKLSWNIILHHKWVLHSLASKQCLKAVDCHSYPKEEEKHVYIIPLYYY